jgi:hypothetical protein
MPKTTKPGTDRNGHLDPDTLGAFAENALTDTEIATVFTHLAECDYCRNWFGVYAEFGSASAKPAITFYLKTAVGLVCAVLLAGLMILPAHYQLSPLERQTRERPPGEDRVEVVNSGAEKVTARRASELSAPSPGQKPRRALRRPTTSWIFASDFSFNSTSHQSMLPAPLASARLGSQISFATISPDPPAAGRHFDQMRFYNQIPVKTPLGLRRVALRLAGLSTKPR